MLACALAADAELIVSGDKHQEIGKIKRGLSPFSSLNQSQPLGNERFYQHIEQMTGQRREGKPRGRPRVANDDGDAAVDGQGELGL